MVNQKKRMGPVVNVCDLLFKKIDKPKNLKHCIANDVGNNRYRINLYTTYTDETDLEFSKISSYMCRVDGDELLFGVAKRTEPGIHGVHMEWHPNPVV